MAEGEAIDGGPRRSFESGKDQHEVRETRKGSPVESYFSEISDRYDRGNPPEMRIATDIIDLLEVEAVHAKKEQGEQSKDAANFENMKDAVLGELFGTPNPETLNALREHLEQLAAADENAGEKNQNILDKFRELLSENLQNQNAESANLSPPPLTGFHYSPAHANAAMEVIIKKEDLVTAA